MEFPNLESRYSILPRCPVFEMFYAKRILNMTWVNLPWLLFTVSFVSLLHCSRGQGVGHWVGNSSQQSSGTHNRQSHDQTSWSVSLIPDVKLLVNVQRRNSNLFCDLLSLVVGVKLNVSFWMSIFMNATLKLNVSCVNKARLCCLDRLWRMYQWYNSHLLSDSLFYIFSVKMRFVAVWGMTR